MRQNRCSSRPNEDINAPREVQRVPGAEIRDEERGEGGEPVVPKGLVKVVS